MAVDQKLAHISLTAAGFIREILIDELFIDCRNYRRGQSVWRHSKQWPIEDRDNSKIRGDLLDIQRTSKQSH